MRYKIKNFYYREIGLRIDRSLKLELTETSKSVLKHLLFDIIELDKLEIKRVKTALKDSLKEEKKEWTKKFKEVKDEMPKT
ncbi:MAG: hypothetical protein AABY22_15575 [Nanoarchaeota archaeon]